MLRHLRCLIPLRSPVRRKADILSDTAVLSKGSLSVINKRAGPGQTPELLFPSELPPVSAPRLSAVVWGNWSWAPFSPLLPAGHSLRNVTGNTRAIYSSPTKILSQCLCLMWHAVQVRQDLVCVFQFSFRRWNILALPLFFFFPPSQH